MTTTEPKEFLTENETAALVRRSTGALQQDRWRTNHGTPTGIPFIKARGRVLYARADVLAYLAANRVDTQERRD